MIEILYQDDAFVAIHKPAGLLVHKSDIDRHETRFALQMVRDQIGQHVFPVHRLDKATSGVLWFATSGERAALLMNLFSEQKIQKRYWAIVRGWLPSGGEQILIDHPLTRIKDAYDKPRVKLEPQSAVTQLRSLATIELPYEVEKFPQTRYSLVEAMPHTGRRHQIRRHLKHVGHPIIGDVRYGKGVHNRFFRSEFGCERLLLACVSTSFSHPVSRAEVTVTCAPESSFLELCERFSWPKQP